MPRFGAFRSAAIATLTLLSMQQTLLHAQEKPASSSTPAAAAATTQPEVATARYLGSETCKTCHEDIYNGWEKSSALEDHDSTQKVDHPNTGARTATGPVQLTSRAAGTSPRFSFSRMHSSKEINKRCMTCHAGGTQHMNAINSEHAQNEVSCIACHSPHHGKDSDFLLVKSQPELCYVPPREES